MVPPPRAQQSIAGARPPQAEDRARPTPAQHVLVSAVGAIAGVPAMFPLLVVHLGLMAFAVEPMGGRQAMGLDDEDRYALRFLAPACGVVVLTLIAAVGMVLLLLLRRRGTVGWWLSCAAGVLTPYVVAAVR